MARGKRRPTFWLAKTFEYQTLGTGPGLSTVVIATPAVLHETPEPTIIRIVGRLWYSYERKVESFQESSVSLCWAGIYCLHEDVTGQSPTTDLEEEHWMWTGFMASWSTFIEFPDRVFDANTIIGGSTASRGSVHNNSGASSVDIDSRSMRKAPESCSLRIGFQVDEALLSSTSSEHFISGYVRVLCKA